MSPFLIAPRWFFGEEWISFCRCFIKKWAFGNTCSATGGDETESPASGKRSSLIGFDKVLIYEAYLQWQDHGNSTIAVSSDYYVMLLIEGSGFMGAAQLSPTVKHTCWMRSDNAHYQLWPKPAHLQAILWGEVNVPVALSTIWAPSLSFSSLLCPVPEVLATHISWWVKTPLNRASAGQRARSPN